MKTNYPQADTRVKKKIVGVKQFIITYVVMMLLAGVQVGIVVIPGYRNISPFFQINIIMLYWAVVALIFCHVTNTQIKKGYDMPMRRLGEAAREVARGDFSIYVEPFHTPDSYDYLDVMFLDFNKMVQELGSIETLKNDFVSSVSHEIKTPLSVIKNYVAALRSDNLSTETRDEYIDTIAGATDKLASLVSNILRLNKLENQEIMAETEPFDLCRQLADCALAFESLIEEKSIEFSAHLEDRAIITADRDMLEIVWNNLLANAIKYTESGGRVSLVQTSDDENVMVSISDTGCGMSEQTMRRIFDKFYQGDTSHSAEGNGLGLALAHRVTQKLGGTISVVSEEGAGSTFTVTLPVA